MHGVFKSTSIMILKTVPCYLVASRECWADITDELGVSEPGSGLFSNRKTFYAPAPTNPSNTVNAQVAPPGLQVSNLRVHLKVKNSQIPTHFGLRRWLSDGKESSSNAGDPGSIPGLGRSPGEGNGYPLQYSCLENPMDRGAWRATSPWGHTESDTPKHDGSQKACLFCLWRVSSTCALKRSLPYFPHILLLFTLPLISSSSLPGFLYISHCFLI